MKKNSLALVIQARMGSSRFPGKAICDLSGATLLERIFQRVKKVKRIGKVILATTKKKEDDILVTIAKLYKIDILRDKKNRNESAPTILDVYYRIFLVSQRFANPGRWKNKLGNNRWP